MQYYTEELLNKTKRQRRISLAVYIVVLVVYLIASALFVWWQTKQPYQDSFVTVIKAIHYTLTGLIVIFSFLYLGIVDKRIRKFYALLLTLKTGIRDTWEASFVRYDEELEVLNGVDFKSLIFLEWNKYKNDFFERKVLVFYEKPFPQLTEGQNVKFVTQSNVLISYEILDAKEN